MQKRSKLARQLEAISPKLGEVEPGFRVPEFKTDAEEIAWLDRNYERLAELTLKHGKRVKLALKEPTRRETRRYRFGCRCGIWSGRRRSRGRAR